MIRIKCNEIEADLIIRALMSLTVCPGTWKCNGQSIGLALAKLEILEKQGCKVDEEEAEKNENENTL